MKPSFIILYFVILLNVKLQAESFSDLLSNISPTNNIEQNYLNYYNLFANIIDQREAEESIPDDDLNALYNLAQLCPPSNGACVYQARALYNSIYRLPIIFDDCGESSSRMVSTTAKETIKIKDEENWKVTLFPNPAQSELNIVCKIGTEFLEVCINDITGRLILLETMKPKNGIANLKLNLLNGAYVIKIKNSTSETIIEKLLIAK